MARRSRAAAQAAAPLPASMLSFAALRLGPSA